MIYNMTGPSSAKAARNAALLPQRQQLVKYDIEKLTVGPLLGSGGFASVFGVWETDCVAANNEKAIEFDMKKKGEDVVVGEADQTHMSDALVSLDASSVSSSSSASNASSDRHHKKKAQEGHNDDNDNEKQQEANACQTKYAIKILHSKSVNDPIKLRISISDFQNEVQILGSLPRHENIIALHGISDDFWTSPKTAFMVLERLVEPLDKAIRRWRKESNTGFNVWLTNKKHLGIVSQAERIQQVAVGLASAMNFLREQLILFRDLKPANIGCGQDGKIKLFDFGLSRKLKSDRTKVIGRNGTLRYMSPECARGEMYSFSSDVYSFGQVLWELLMLEKPFRKIKDKTELNFIVVKKDKHPAVNKISSPAMRRLLVRCWNADPEERPTFSRILSDLKKEVTLRLSQQ